ncbi:related to Mitochondrial DnaJ homolog 2 [Saccharomycodes ludwigii]|uniref:Related to Mitochondrial DnaJ homolog 2 n=1 Tax=Saccharomycodes ludwigii TaxID=36035 RepID=A0A376B3Q1_9ASCO|nr:hypothetical protein SCDLUD_004988 [Saccharomycodes ludwigii]KAH3898666.1 hypothetical protein SCDLUD_004988 [Saccharomycodes ludwigii]SSD58750.1 related to Mitochondrial DnaJ homolog 2 [Saccharomycodes ludwigii]
MVLPLIIGTTITLVALTARAGLKAWSRYKRLTFPMIAELNGIPIIRTTASNSSTRISGQVKFYLDHYQGGFIYNDNKKMDPIEAILILGLNQETFRKTKIDEQLIKSSHRKLMILNHPDKGGSPLIASKINEAREVLLTEIKSRNL